MSATEWLSFAFYLSEGMAVDTGLQENIAKGLLMYDKLEMARISIPYLGYGHLRYHRMVREFDQRDAFVRPSRNSEKGMPIPWLGVPVAWLLGCP